MGAAKPQGRVFSREGPLSGVLLQDPTAGVTLIDTEGRILWCNEQLARMTFGVGAKAEQFIGKTLFEVLPREVAEHRVGLMRRMACEGSRPVFLRTIWQGLQYATWIQYVSPTEGDEGWPPHFVLVTRRYHGEIREEVPVSDDFVIEESPYISLGPLDVLTPRELEVLALLSQGMSVKHIAGLLQRSEKTIETHRASIGRKLQVDDRVMLAEIARKAGLTREDADKTRV
jgi:DNA-binding CsgD family transcriptional regulator